MEDPAGTARKRPLDSRCRHQGPPEPVSREPLLSPCTAVPGDFQLPPAGCLHSKNLQRDQKRSLSLELPALPEAGAENKKEA